jgi:hypothetical protein
MIKHPGVIMAPLETCVGDPQAPTALHVNKLGSVAHRSCLDLEHKGTFPRIVIPGQTRQSHHYEASV